LAIECNLGVLNVEQQEIYQCKLIYVEKKFGVKNVELLQFATSTGGLYQGDPNPEKL
jgi:hypothetical protein